MPWEKPSGASYLDDASPFRLPIALRRVRCVFADPLPPPRVAHNPTSSVLGVVLDRMLSLATSERVATTWLYKPRCEALKRDFPSPIAWSLEQLDERSFSGLLILWGRHAMSAEEFVWRAFERSSRDGMTLEGKPRPFSIEASAWFRGTCASWLEALPSPLDGVGVATSAATEIDLPSLCADAVVQLFYWDLADSNSAEAIGRATADRLAESLRREIRHAFCSLPLEHAVGDRVSEGRHSRTNLGQFGVSRWDARHFLGPGRRDDLLTVWPWIALMSLRGPGPRKRFGVSEARVFLPEEVDRLPAPV